MVKDLAEVVRVTEKARDNTRSMGVALSAGSIPETGEKTFELPDDELEIGMGLHGEPGVSREKMLMADLLVEKMMERIIADLPFKTRDEVLLLINGLGATTMMELMIANRRVRQLLDEQGLAIAHTYFGPYFTCQEMAGFSLSLMRLEGPLESLLDRPVWSLGYRG